MTEGPAASAAQQQAAACPKCGGPRDPAAVECAHCGVVFHKYEQREAQRPSAASIDAERLPIAATDTEPIEDPLRGPIWWGRAALVGVLAWWTWSFARTPFGPALGESVLHLPNLVFHEAGHMFFIPFGEFMTSLGGSLFQCALPLGLAGAFLHQGNRFGAIVCLWWAGQNLVDIAAYIADARSLRLVLLGGRTGAEVEGHDWEFILSELGWLHRDRTLGVSAYRIGVLVMMVTTAAGAWLLTKEKRRASAGVRLL